ncbi:hypothetical protein [Hyphomicrobium sp. CS1GBMeth3]|nr:hypothetical protein [Hyphomicrobium sp. CS1GBMeth3]
MKWLKSDSPHLHPPKPVGNFANEHVANWAAAKKDEAQDAQMQLIKK